jgi:hypothetical protein
MKYRIFSTIPLCLIMAWACSAQERASMDLQYPKLTQERAIAAVRSKEHNSDSSFQIILEVEPSARTREVAQLSFHEASSQRVSIYGDGIFLDLLKTGGFLIMQVDSKTGGATALHLVSRGDDGRDAIQSSNIEHEVNPVLVRQLSQQTAEFVADLLRSSSSGLVKFESRFYGGGFPGYDNPQKQSLFSIPRKVRQMKPVSNESTQLASIIGAFQLWPTRYAISMPVYAANPNRAMELARQKQKDLVRQFLQENNKSPDFIYDLQDLESIQTAEQLADRISWFRRLQDLLDRTYESLGDSNSFTINCSISTIALEFQPAGRNEEDSYAVMTSSGLIVVWRRPQSSGFAIAEVTLAE